MSHIGRTYQRDVLVGSPDPFQKGRWILFIVCSSVHILCATSETETHITARKLAQNVYAVSSSRLNSGKILNRKKYVSAGKNGSMSPLAKLQQLTITQYLTRLPLAHDQHRTIFSSIATLLPFAPAPLQYGYPQVVHWQRSPGMTWGTALAFHCAAPASNK